MNLMDPLLIHVNKFKSIMLGGLLIHPEFIDVHNDKLIFDVLDCYRIIGDKLDLVVDKSITDMLMDLYA